ncbi:MAG: phage baseplate assembly protein [Alphaproteobacteria bacterium]|nr:phage baseplate assembly protein [Alphaproteobacteria bacterium]
MNMIDRLMARIWMTVGRGRVQYVNDAAGVQIVQLQMGSNETVDGMPRVQEYGFTSKPKPGAHAIAIFIGGDRSNGAVIATNDLDARLTGLQDGEVAIYDDLGQKVHLTRTGIIVETPFDATLTGKNIVIHATDSLKIDCGGNGTSYTPGARTDYVTGATVTTSPLNPPEIP